MMNHNQKQREIRNRFGRLSEVLVGPPAEISLGESQELLTMMRIDTESLTAVLYAGLYKKAQEYWTAGKMLPPQLKRALEELRPSSAPPRNEQELSRQARSHVEKMLEQAKILPMLSAGQSPQYQVSAFRKKGKLTEKDRKLLEEIAENMRKKTKPEDTES